MQINRLIEMVYILLDRKVITAKELSEHFEVSQRTVYRDIEALSAAGIPIYTTKGKGGGVGILDNFVLNKSILTEKEQMDILSSLQSLKVLAKQDVEPVLNKLAGIFGKGDANWIDVDFTRWSSNNDEKERFNIFKTAILNKRIVTFDYYSSKGEKNERIVEPLKLVFKGYAWYVYGYCRVKNDFRMFKVSRIKKLCITDKLFKRDIPKTTPSEPPDTNANMLSIVLKFSPRVAFRILDEFSEGNCVENPDGSFTVTTFFPGEEWVCGYILSFGDDVEVLEPVHIRDKLKDILKNCLKKY